MASISDFHTVSTNYDDKIVLNDVTRDDLVDIINRAFKESKTDKLTELIDDLYYHTNQKGKNDPHEFNLDQLKESAFDRVYAFWLKKGFQGTPENLKNIMYKYCQEANQLMLFSGKEQDSVVTVKALFDYLSNAHDKIINDYNNINIFIISEKYTHWSGIVSGIEIQTDETLKSIPDNIPTIFPNKNGKATYTWKISIPPNMENSKISIDVNASRGGIIKYRILGVIDEWTQFTGELITEDYYTPDVNDTDGNPPYVGKLKYKDPTTYRYRVPTNVERLLILRNNITDDPRKNNEIIYEFMIDFGDNNLPLTINDIITTIDATESLTDDSLRTELYADIRHKNIWQNFFTIPNQVPYCSFAWYNNISRREGDNNISWFNTRTGSFNLAVQIHPNILEDRGNSDYIFSLVNLLTTQQRADLDRYKNTNEIIDISNLFDISVSYNSLSNKVRNSDFIIYNNNDHDGYIEPKLVTNLTIDSLENNENTTYYQAIRKVLFQINGENDTYFQIFSECGGYFNTKNSFNTKSILKLTNVNFGIKIKARYEETEVYCPELVKYNRPLYRIFFTYNLFSGNITIWYHTPNGIEHISKFLGKYYEFIPISWDILEPADVSDNNFLGVHELIYYPDRYVDENLINCLIHSGMCDVPYLI